MLEILKSSATRIKTAIALFAAFLIVGYVDIKFVTWLMFGALLKYAVIEAKNLFEVEESDNNLYITTAIIWVAAYFYPKPEDLVFVGAVLFASVLAYTRTIDKKIFLVLMYPIAAFLFIFSLYVSYGFPVLLWLVALVAGADIGAYFVGRSIGKTKFCETSPNKTLEGVAGGIVFAAALGLIFTPESLQLQWYVSLVIGLFVSASSVFGDLFESYLKREADVKDSGDILPGHGGILDRSDGFLFGGIILLILLRIVA